MTVARYVDLRDFENPVLIQTLKLTEVPVSGRVHPTVSTTAPRGVTLSPEMMYSTNQPHLLVPQIMIVVLMGILIPNYDLLFGSTALTAHRIIGDLLLSITFITMTLVMFFSALKLCAPIRYFVFYKNHAFLVRKKKVIQKFNIKELNLNIYQICPPEQSHRLIIEFDGSKKEGDLAYFVLEIAPTLEMIKGLATSFLQMTKGFDAHSNQMTSLRTVIKEEKKWRTKLGLYYRLYFRWLCVDIFNPIVFWCLYGSREKLMRQWEKVLVKQR